MDDIDVKDALVGLGGLLRALAEAGAANRRDEDPPLNLRVTAEDLVSVLATGVERMAASARERDGTAERLKVTEGVLDRVLDDLQRARDEVERARKTNARMRKQRDRAKKAAEDAAERLRAGAEVGQRPQEPANAASPGESDHQASPQDRAASDEALLIAFRGQLQREGIL